MIIDNKIGFYSTGIIGSKNIDALDNYKKTYFKFIKLFNENKLTTSCDLITNIDNDTAIADMVGPLSEELCWYYICNYYKYKTHAVLPIRMFKELGDNDTANKVGYTHLWGKTKHNKIYITAIKNKILTMFPEYAEYIDKYDKLIYDASNGEFIYDDINDILTPIGLDNLM